MHPIYPDSRTLEVPEGRPHEPESYLTPEGYTFVKQTVKNGASWQVYRDGEGLLWKMSGFRSTTFLTPYIEDEVSGPTTAG